MTNAANHKMRTISGCTLFHSVLRAPGMYIGRGQKLTPTTDSTRKPRIEATELEMNTTTSERQTGIESSIKKIQSLTLHDRRISWSTPDSRPCDLVWSPARCPRDTLNPSMDPAHPCRHLTQTSHSGKESRSMKISGSPLEKLRLTTTRLIPLDRQVKGGPITLVKMHPFTIRPSSWDSQSAVLAKLHCTITSHSRLCRPITTISNMATQVVVSSRFLQQGRPKAHIRILFRR